MALHLRGVAGVEVLKQQRDAFTLRLANRFLEDFDAVPFAGFSADHAPADCGGVGEAGKTEDVRKTKLRALVDPLLNRLEIRIPENRVVHPLHERVRAHVGAFKAVLLQ